MANPYEPLEPRSVDPLSLENTGGRDEFFRPVVRPVSEGVEIPFSSGEDDVMRLVANVSAGLTPGLGDLLDADAREDMLLDGFATPTANSGMKPDALELKGVNWETPRTSGTRTFVNDPGFWNVDYDPSGARGVKLGTLVDGKSPTATTILAANVFGRQFSRDELMKDDEGRRLVTLMEKQRSGEHRQEGFLAGLASFSDTSGSYRKALADIPFLGWMVDGGQTVSETIGMSKTMRKLQNGEAVSDHDAIAVRRYMLQNEMDSQRGIGYNAGSVIHSSIPFMVEMGLSSTMLAGVGALAAKAAAIGTAAGPVGTAVGAAIGAAIGVVGAVLFGGAGRLFSKSGRAVLFGKSKIVPELAEYATRGFAQGFTKNESEKIFSTALKASGMGAKDLAKAASSVGNERALEALGREAAVSRFGEAAVAKWAPERFVQFAKDSGVKGAALKKRAAFEKRKFLAESYRNVFDADVDRGLARYLMVEGDVVNKFNAGLYQAAKAKILGGEVTDKTGYLAMQKALRSGFPNVFKDDAAKKAFVSEYVNGVLDGVGHPVGSTGLKMVEDSMRRVLGPEVGLNRGFSKEVATEMGMRALKNFELAYSGDWFGANAGSRLFRWLEDGVLDGLLRWDRSVFSGVGTMARSGSALGGKMDILKEALRVSFVEAPVKNALLYTAQAPVWAVTSAATGNGPGDFAIRGQLGIQAKALETGDRELMDHARAIAFGAGLVEYISEGAGRGLNMLGEGIVAPAARGLMPGFTKDFGSWMSRKMAALYGSDVLMKDSTRATVAQAVDKLVKDSAVRGLRKPGSDAVMSVPFKDIELFLKNHSAKGIRSIEEFCRATGRTERQLVSEAIRTSLHVSKQRAAILSFTAHYMIDKGITPQKMSQIFERVGYDGILSEMAEERYGGFFQGLFGLDASPSDSSFRDRWSAAMDGLFPDKDQLITEAIGFAFPCITTMAMHGLYGRLGQGVVPDYKAAVNRLSQIKAQNGVTLSIGGLTASEAAALAEAHDAEAGLMDRAFGTDDGNRANAGDVAATKFGSYAPSSGVNADLGEAKTAEEFRTKAVAKVDAILDEAGAGRVEDFNKAVVKYDGGVLFGVDGVEAIKNMWRRRGGEDDVTRRLYAEGGEIAGARERYRAALEKARKTKTVADAVADISAQLPAVSQDTSVVADESDRFRSNDATRARVNDFSSDLAGDMAYDLDTIANIYLEYERNADRGGNLFRRGMMRLVGILNAVTTGDISLAARNPVQWAMMDNGLDTDIANHVAGLKKKSVIRGQQLVMAELAGSVHSEDKALRDRYSSVTDIRDFDDAFFKRCEDAGHEWYRNALEDYARQVLAARNVLAVSQTDIEAEALRVYADSVKHEVGGKTVYGDENAEDFTTEKFRADHADGIAAKRDEIVSTMADMVTRGVIAYNTKKGFGGEDVTMAAYDYRRAMQYGTVKEIAAAVRRMPAFRHLRSVHDLSGGRVLGDEFGGAVGRVGDVDELIRLPDDSHLWTEDQLRKALVAMGRSYGTGTAAENRLLAETFVRRLTLAVSRMTPAHVYLGNDEVETTFSYAPDKNGNRRIFATVYGQDGVGLTFGGEDGYANYVDAAKGLTEAGYDVEMPKVVLMENTSFTSKDATSLAMFILGDRESARRWYLDNGIVDEQFLPPYLRKDGDAFLYDEAEASRILKEEMSSSDENVRRQAFGDGKIDSPFRWGYESLSQKYLESRQIERDSEDPYARTVVGESSYTAHTSGLPIGNTLYITSDYYAEGDSEALLRSSLAQAIYQFIESANRERRDYVQGVFREMTKSFLSIGRDAVERMETRNPEIAARLRTVLDSLDLDRGATSPSRLAAMAASLVFFTSDRGVNGAGNGFLMSPELAYLSDLARASKWTPLFYSAVDEALGGTGFFTGDKASYNGLAPFIRAFAPDGKDVEDSRRSALFTEDPTGQAANAAPVRIARLTWTEEFGGVARTLVPTVVEDSVAGLTDKGAYVRAVADNCHAYAEAYNRTSADGPLTLGKMYEMLKRADVEGGDAAEPKPSIRVNGVEHSVYENSHRKPNAADAISDEDALGIMRTLKFMIPGDITVNTVGDAYRELNRLTAPARRFLLSRGMSPDNVTRVLAQLPKTVDFTAEAAPDTSDADAAAEVDDEVGSGEGNKELIQAEHASNAYVNNKDLAVVGNMLSHVFPSEGKNFTALFKELSELFVRMQETDPSDVHEKMAKWFAVLRTPRSSTAESEIARKSQPWSDNEVTDAILDSIIAELNESGRHSFAFLLSAVRGIDSSGKRRTQALQQIAFSDQKDANEIHVSTDGGLSVSVYDQVSGGTVDLRTMRAIARGIVLSPTLAPTYAKAQPLNLQSVVYGIWALNNNSVTYDAKGNATSWQERNFSTRWKGTKNGTQYEDALTGKSVAEFRGILSDATKDESKLIDRFCVAVGLARNVDPNTGRVTWAGTELPAKVLSASEYDVVVEFAKRYLARHSAVADAIDYVFGNDVEISRMLRNPETVASVVSDVVNALSGRVADRNAASGIIRRLVREFEVTGSAKDARGNVKVVSRLFDNIVMPVLNGAALAAIRTKGAKGEYAGSSLVPLAIRSAGVTQDDLLSGLVKSDIELMYLQSDLSIQSQPGAKTASELDWSKFLVSPASFRSSSRSSVARVVERFQRSLARPTAKIQGQDSAELTESKSSPRVTPSPEPVGDRIIDGCFSKVKVDGKSVKDALLANGRRWDDGSRLTTVTAGAKIDDAVQDKSLLSMIVYRANRERYESGDSNFVMFELYHSEKPTVMSVRIPRKVAEQILADIGAGKDYTVNRVTKALKLGTSGFQLPTGEGSWVLSPLTPSRTAPTAKDQRKFNKLGGITKYIGFGGGSTGHYGSTAFSSIANTGSYEPGDIVGVSVNGGTSGRVSLSDPRYQEELGKAVAAGVTFVADEKAYRERSAYNVGERELAEYLMSNGYEEVDGSGVWRPSGTSGLTRADEYDAIFSVLAHHGGFEHITTKRVQVIMSNATPVPVFRDSVDFVDGNGDVDTREFRQTNAKTGETVVPGMHTVVTLSGRSATNDQGMYFHWGAVVEGQRKLQTNKDAISHKNHILSRGTSLLKKGQAHAIGLGIYEGERTFTTGRFTESQRRMRRKLERVLGLADGILDLPSDADRADPARSAERATAVAAVEEFARHSSLVCNDHEVEKCGPLASGSGFAADEGGAIHAVVGGKDVWVRVHDGKWQGKADENGEFADLKYGTVPEYKGGSYAIALTVPAMMETLGLDRLEDKDVFDREASTGIVSKWVDAAGRETETETTLDKSGVFRNLGTAKGDRLSFYLDDSGYECDFFTREAEAQIMANSDATSAMSHDHPGATNWGRDNVTNAARAGRDDTARMALTLARFVPYLAVKANEDAFRARISGSSADFARRIAAYPNSASVRTEYAKKRDSLMAKMQRAYVMSTHAVLCGSGITCEFHRNADGTMRIEYDYAAGVTEYDKSTFQCARTVPAFARPVFGTSRTYSTMRANVSGDSRFRYGWHLDEAAVMTDPEVTRLLAGPLASAYAAATKDLTTVYRDPRHPDGKNVSDAELDSMARTVALLSVFSPSSRSRSGQRAVRGILGRLFTDYTGKKVSDNRAVSVDRVSFDDLFVDGHFDYAALECGSRKKLTPDTAESKGVKTVYLGGSFYAGDRRPSGNFESASGFARVQAPVDYDADGNPGDSSLYILDPAMGKVQGSDTDGDSTTGTSFDGPVTETDREFMNYMRDAAVALVGRMDSAEFDVSAEARNLFRKLVRNEKFGKYVRLVEEDMSYELTDEFNRMIGNVLFEEQANGYRKMPVGFLDASGGLVDADDAPVVGMNGMLETGPSPLKIADPAHGGPEFPTAGRFADIYRNATGKDPKAGMSWDDAFKACVNALSGGKAKPDLLSPFDHAWYSAEAADANGGRGVSVSNQAALEHLVGQPSDAVRDMLPGLLGDVERGMVPFVSHIAGVSDSLFDVVKDLFAPRCGWKKSMLTYLYGRLVGEAERSRGEDPDVVFDHAWFFEKLVSYTSDFHKSETSVAHLLDLYHSWNNFETVDKYTGRTTFAGVFEKHKGDGAFSAFLDEGYGMWRKGDHALVAAMDSGTVLYGEDLVGGFNGYIGMQCGMFLKMIGAELRGEGYQSPRKAQTARNRYRGMCKLLSELVPTAFNAVVDGRDVNSEDAKSSVLALGREFFRTLFGEPAEDLDDRYSVGRDMLTALRGFLLFGDVGGFESRYAAVKRTIEDERRFAAIKEYEAAYSPEPAAQMGGGKVRQQLRSYRNTSVRDLLSSTDAGRVQVAATMLRMSDMSHDSEHPLTVAESVSDHELGRIGGTLDDPSGNRYFTALFDRGIVRPHKTADEIDYIALSQLIAVPTITATTGRCLENLGYLQHLVGALKIGLGAMSAEELGGLLWTDAGRNVSAVVARLSEDAVRSRGRIHAVQNDGTALVFDERIGALFRMFRTDRNGKIDFVSKLGPEDVSSVREAFRLLSESDLVIWNEPGREGRPKGVLTGRQLAALMRIEIARTVDFDAADELDVRGNVAQLFGDEVNEMERWGRAASRNLALRTLTILPLSKNGAPGFDLWARASFDNANAAADLLDGSDTERLSPFKLADFMDAGAGEFTVERDHVKGLVNLTVIDLMLSMVQDGTSSLQEAYDLARRPDDSARPDESRPAVLGTLHTDTRFPGVLFSYFSEGEEYTADSIEEALNEHIRDVRREVMADPDYAGLAAVDEQVAERVAFIVDGDGEQSAKAFLRDVLRRTDEGPCSQALRAGVRAGDAMRFLGISLGVDTGIAADGVAGEIEEALAEFARETAWDVPGGKPKISGSVAKAADRPVGVTLSRMKRSDFLEYTKAKDPELYRKMSKNPVENIRFALEKVFGKWSDKTGVKVERVSRKDSSGKYLPVNLIRVTRKITDKNGTHNVTTYISYGDQIPMNLASKAYMASMLEAINATVPEGGRKMTLADVESMTEAQRLALANSLNLRVLGESKSRNCVSTDCLLAMTGLIRLSDSADYWTLFHEYFHQMLDFLRETKVCTDSDIEALTKEFRRSDGKLDEEAAADAFAAFLMEGEELPEEGKLLSAGVGDRDRVFAKIKHTAQAYLAGALAYDSEGVPAFMKMMISGDFSDVELENVTETTKTELKEVENALLGEEMSVQTPDMWESPEANRGLHRARIGVQTAVLGLRTGVTDASDVKDAAQAYVDELSKPGNRVTFEGVLDLYDGDDVTLTARRPVTTLETRLADPGVPAAERVRLFFEEALKRFGDGSIAAEYLPLVDRISDASTWGMAEVDGTAVSLAESTARAIVSQTAEVLGLVFEEDVEHADGSVTTELNELGRLLVSDRRVAELALRLVYEGNRAKQETVNPNGPAKSHVSAYDVVGTSLATVAPRMWGTYARESSEQTQHYFESAAESFDQRAAAEDSAGNGRGAAELRRQAALMRKRADVVRRLVNAIATGRDVTGVIPSGRSRGGSMYEYAVRFVTDSSERVRMMDGRTTFRGTDESSLGLDYSGRYVQLALDSASRALALACVVRRAAKENGVDLPALGGDVELPDNAVRPPAEGIYEPDVVPQVILQSPGAWLAGDLMNQFYGGSLRDMLTDTSLQAATEESNRLANSVIFAFGANVPEGGYLNKLTTVTSNLGLDDGVMTYDKSNAHTATRVSAVRGYLLGLVNRTAETVGDQWESGDVNCVSEALQCVSALIAGEPVVTGYDVSLMHRKRLVALINEYEAKTGERFGVISKATDPAFGGPFSKDEVMKRARGRISGATRPSNLDVLLSRMIEGLSPEVLGYDEKTGMYRDGGLYCKVLSCFVGVAFAKKRDAETGKDRFFTDQEYQEDVVSRLTREGLVATSETGKTVLTIPTSLIKAAWYESGTYRKLTDAGRSKATLDLDLVASVIARDANRLHGVAAKSRFLRDQEGAALSHAGRQGLYFTAGTGFHRLVTESWANARARFSGRPSPAEVIRKDFLSLQKTVNAHEREVVHYLKGADGKFVRDTNGDKIVESVETPGEKPAFAVNADGFPVNVSTAQIQFLMRLLGYGSRSGSGAIREFLARVESGAFDAKEGGEPPYGIDIAGDMTVLDFDRLMFRLVTTLVTEESMGRKTSLTISDEDGGLGCSDQDVVDLMSVVAKLGESLVADEEKNDVAKGRVNTMTDLQAFRRYGTPGTSMTAPQRLQAMAESVVHAERFRGCLAQMLCSVGQDGTPNYVVRPSDNARDFMPDAFWQAVARFLADRLGDRVPGVPAYDPGLTGLRNVQLIADSVARHVEKKETKGTSRFRAHMLPPDDVAASGIFDSIICRDDSQDDDVSVLAKTTNRRLSGSEAAGYMKQLLGSLTAPSQWSGWRVVDRMMSYSKAASVQMSAFFAFATRFESPVAACGFWNTVVGYRGWTTKLVRSDALKKVADKLGLDWDRNMPYLADYMNSITSDDPAIRDMRILLDMVGIPMTDAIQNPMNDRQGAIDRDIKRISGWLMANGFKKTATEVREALEAALHNPSEYAFSNVLNGVKMAVAAQTLFRLRRECEEAGRPFDPVRELRRHSAYINSEIGGIQAERYAWLTPGMQRFLRLAMFSYNWTIGAWVAGTGEVMSDVVFGGHNTTPEMRQRALIRWLRMLGIIKVGVPMTTQLLIKALATALVKSGVVGDPGDPDDKDPLAAENMPWLCFFNESKVGALSFDVTPILKLVGRSQTAVDMRLGHGVWPAIGAVAGATALPVLGGIYGFLTGGAKGAARGVAKNSKIWTTVAGATAGAAATKLVPAYSNIGHPGPNAQAGKRYYMHFGKQSDEFWRWFTGPYGQLTSKLSIPTQKTLEAFFGSVSGGVFGEKFEDMAIADRFFTTSLDPNKNAWVNFATSFAPFSAASVASHPDAGILGVLGPVQMGLSKTQARKTIERRMLGFARLEAEKGSSVWTNPKNRTEFRILCSDILREAKTNGLDPKTLVDDSMKNMITSLYIDLMDCLPREKGDKFDSDRAAKTLRVMFVLNRKISAIRDNLRERYKDAGVDWRDQKNEGIRWALKKYLAETAKNPYRTYDSDAFDRFFELDAERAVRTAGVQQDAKGGENFSNFLATDDVPDTLFGIPVVSGPYTEEDLEFFREFPEAGGYYDMGDGDAGTRGGVGAGYTKASDSMFSKKIRELVAKSNRLPTEKTIYDAHYGEDGDSIREAAMAERLSRYDEESRAEIKSRGITDLESVPIVPPGKVGRWTPKYESRKSKVAKNGYGKPAIVFGGPYGTGFGFGLKGTEILKSLNKTKGRDDYNARNYSIDKVAENDDIHRSFSMPGTSAAVVYSPYALAEEARHIEDPVLLTADDPKETSDQGRDRAVAEGVPKDAAYHVYGRPNERAERMFSVKALTRARGYDITNGKDREKMLDQFDQDKDKDLSDHDRIMIREMKRLRDKKRKFDAEKDPEKRKKYEFTPREQNAYDWLSSDSMWLQVKNGGTRHTGNMA